MISNAMFLRTLVIALCIAFGFAACPHRHTNKLPLNERPIIGVLSMEVGPTSLGPIYGNHKSHIAASYVKYLEGAGARVVPIMINETYDYYKNIMNSVNGIFIPGAPTTYTERVKRSLFSRGIVDGSGYAMGGAIIFQLAKKLNNEGVYFPIWGTCLGFQFLTFLTAGNVDFRTTCSANNLIIPLDFTPEYKDSRMFGNAPTSIIETLYTTNVAPHFHEWCITEKNMTKHGLKDSWNILATNKDEDGLEFVSAIEGKKYPFYGTIFHPERIGYEWLSVEDTPHDLEAIKVMQYFADFFINEARKNNQHFKTPEEEKEALIYNYAPEYTGDLSTYQQIYFFD